MDQLVQPPLRYDVICDPLSLEVVIDDVRVPLSKTEFRVLQFLVHHEGSACTRREIIEGVQGEDCPVTDRSVDVQIAAIRRKVGRFAKFIETVRGVGFRFQEPDNGWRNGAT
jgi:two-component system phosphate regulon response regulator PhoB